MQVVVVDKEDEEEEEEEEETEPVKTRFFSCGHATL